ncbi:MAG: CDP-diacylglycerol--glycerol-3-phosphate 3-phosphatidyltransferase [Firmicutes bacterium]|nr:CDP-diacylglycerol--glycerol-3-phosphate 3-phosphatidyltransferase [Bacillota bacterium]
MNKIDIRKQAFTIPNILTYIRILSIPAIICFTVIKSTYVGATSAFPNGFPIIGLCILLFAALTDVADGWIARKFNMTSDVGKALDPLADKLMHLSVLIALVASGHVHYAFLIVLGVKEIILIVGGILLFKHAKVIQANIQGKIASTIISVAAMMSFFHDFFKERVFYLDWIVWFIGIAIAYYALILYLKLGVDLGKKTLQEEKEEREKATILTEPNAEVKEESDTNSEE